MRTRNRPDEVHWFRPAIEPLEARLVLSHDAASVAVSASLEFAMHLAGLPTVAATASSKGPLSAPAQPIYTGAWVVQTDGSVTGAQIDDALEIVTASVPMGFSPGHYALGTSVALEEVASFYQTLRNRPGVTGAYPILALPMIQTQFVPTDEFFVNQWHLRNVGQSGGTPGEDLNVSTAWDLASGTGVVIAIVDEGVQYTHQDLDDNYDAANDFDFLFFDNDPMPNFAFGEGHGTSVAGLAAAEANNGPMMDEGVAGVAFNATLVSLRMLPFAGDANIALALSHRPDLIDVYNNSWGFGIGGDGLATLSENILPLTRAALAAGGLAGEIYVFAGGNDRTDGGNVNFDETKSSRFVIPVAALNDDGQFAIYSSPGAPLIVSGYGGLFAPPETIFTTDLLGANTGSGNFAGDDDYTDRFNGTSAAAPEVAGIIALMLEANPTLTVRDVRKILALTARHNDPANADWTANGAGHLVNHNYGFGAADAAAAVALAASWPGLGPEVSFESGPITIGRPIQDFETVVSTFTVTPRINIEHVEVVFNAIHSFRGDLEIELISPMGTRSILANSRLTDPGTSYFEWVFGSARYLDESSVGTWTLIVRDNQAMDSGILDNWRLSIFGEVLPPATNDRIAVASDAGRGSKSLVKVFDIDGMFLFEFSAYDPDFRGGVRIATGDLDQDGIPDIVTVPNRCAQALVRVFSGEDGRLLAEFSALSPDYTFGASVAVGDVNGDGQNDIVVAANRGSSVVQIFVGPDFHSERAFLAFDAQFIGGVSIAVADVNGDGRSEIIAGAGSGGVPLVRVFDARTLAILQEFLAYDTAFRGGVFVAASDFTGDGTPDIVTGQGRRGTCTVRVFDGVNTALRASFQAFSSPDYAPVHVGVADDPLGNGTVDILASDGSDGRTRQVRRFHDADDDGTIDAVDTILADDPDFRWGMFVS